jgi:hypothetical protein
MCPNGSSLLSNAGKQVKNEFRFKYDRDKDISTTTQRDDENNSCPWHQSSSRLPSPNQLRNFKD